MYRKLLIHTCSFFGRIYLIEGIMMDISNIQNNYNTTYTTPMASDSELTNELSSKINPKYQQNNKIKPDNVQQQFKEVSKKEETSEAQRTYSEISTTTSTTQTKSTNEEILKIMQQILQKPDYQNITVSRTNIVEVLQDTQLNKLKERNKEENNNLQNKLLGEEKNSSLRNLTLLSNPSLFKNWLKRIGKKPDLDVETEEIEDIAESLFQENDVEKKDNSQKANKIKNSSLVKQQQLFSLNMQASLRYLKNLKTFNHKYSPEMLIYDKDTGYVDAEETLECLGWDEIENFQTTLNTELNLNKIKEIHTNDAIINTASYSGINVYKATHPLHNDKKVTLAIESLTGDITMINQLTDLEKLELKGKVYKIYNVAS